MEKTTKVMDELMKDTNFVNLADDLFLSNDSFWSFLEDFKKVYNVGKVMELSIFELCKEYHRSEQVLELAKKSEYPIATLFEAGRVLNPKEMAATA